MNDKEQHLDVQNFSCAEYLVTDVQKRAEILWAYFTKTSRCKLCAAIISTK